MRRGADYLRDISQDGRTILVDGKRVSDVTTESGFVGPARVISRLYDEAHGRTELAYVEDGVAYSGMWLPPRSTSDLALRRRVHRHWAEGSFGLMGRTPDHVAALITAFAANRHVFERGGAQFGANIDAFYRQARDNDWFLAYAVTPPQVDRSKPPHQQPEPFLFPGIVEERDDGIVLRGAQMIATSAAIADWLFISSIVPMQPGDEDYAISVAVPLNAEGLRIYPRRPYASIATSTYDYPLSSRFDESDSLVILRDVFVPWERVFVHRDTQLLSAQFYETGGHILANYQALVRFQVKAEFASGLASELADMHGISAIPPVQAQLGGDIAAFSSALEAIVLAAEGQPVQRGELLVPGPKFVYSGVSLQRRWVVDFMRALRELAGGGFIAIPSAESFSSPETAEDVARYYQTLNTPAWDRVKLLKLMWDLVGTEFAGRQLQYEMFFSAAQHVVDRQVFRAYDWDTGRKHVQRLLESS
jgi:4-hydroxyphenylacetate 3-monooxygenase